MSRPLPSHLRAVRSETGDWICTEGDCTVGEALVRQMLSFYLKTIAELQTDAAKLKEFISRYSKAVSTIAQSYEDANSRWSRKLIPFSTWCCTIKEIGGQAQRATQDIASFTGARPPDAVQLSRGGGGFPWLWVVGGVVGGALAARWLMTSGKSG